MGVREKREVCNVGQKESAVACRVTAERKKTNGEVGSGKKCVQTKIA